MGKYASITRTGRNEDFNLHVKRGFVEGHEHIHKFGYNSTVSTTERPVWDGAIEYVYPTSAGPCLVVSTTAVDTGSKITVQGLDQDYNQITNIVTLNGTTTVATSGTFFRVFRAFISNDVSCVGDVNINLDGNLNARIDQAEGQTLMAIYTIPAGYTGYLQQINMATGTELANKYITVSYKEREPGGVFRTKAKYTLANQFAEETYPYPLEIPEKTDVQIRARSSSGEDEMSALFDILLIKNESQGS